MERVKWTDCFQLSLKERHDECSSLLTQGKGKNMAEKSSFRHPEIVCINLNRNCADVSRHGRFLSRFLSPFFSTF